MTIEQCYQVLGGSYEEVNLRLPSLRLVEKFIAKFLTDTSFDTLCAQMDSGNREEAFRAAHTLKGGCANLVCGRLQDTSSRLTEVLRPEGDRVPEEALSLMEEVTGDYDATVGAIRAYLDAAG